MRVLTLGLLSSCLISFSFSWQAANVPAKRESSSMTPVQRWIEIPGKQEFTGRLIVRPTQRLKHMASGKSLEQAIALGVAARTALARFDREGYVPQTDETLLLIPKGSNEQAISDALMATGLFQYAEPDWLLYPCAPPQSIGASNAQAAGNHDPVSASRRPLYPNDPQFTGQWHHESNVMNSCLAWGVTTGNPSIAIAICDTGIRTTHEDLQLNRLEGYNAYDRLWESQGGQVGPSPHSHGTKTTGAAAANGNNGVGISGVGWNLSHRMMRVSNLASGSAPLSVLQHAARTAAEAGDRVASVSYTGAQATSNLTTATYVRSLGSILAWAADNSSTDYSFANRDDDDLIVVGATDSGDGLAWFSSFGSYVDLMAPGVDISTTSASDDQSYSSPSGTSLSTPLVNGLMGVIWSERPTLSPTDVEAILKRSCDDIGAAGVDDTFGYGRVNMLTALLNSGSQVPDADFAAPNALGVGPLTVDFRDLSSGVPTTWLWDFGDGNTSTEQNPSHTYPTSGSYSVSLAVSNVHGMDLHSIADYVLVDIAPPVVDFHAMPMSGPAPLPVQFTDDSVGGLVATWLWDFGDGNTSTQQNPSHTYTVPGEYTVSLTATNAYGSDVLSRTDFIEAE